MVCFDTDFLIAYLRGEHDAIKKLESLKSRPDSVAATTMINAAELWKGVYRSKEKQKEISKVRWLLDSLELLTLDYESARITGELNANIKANPIGELDLLIASIATTNKQILITRNKKHFAKIPSLQIEEW